MANPGQNQETLSVGEQVADLEITEKLGGGGGVHLWTGVREDGSRGTVFALDGGLGPVASNQFLAAASEAAAASSPLEGTVPVAAVDPLAGAYVGAVDATGTLADLPILNWNRERKVQLFRELCEIVARLHEQSLVHGWLRPENILLDGAFSPLVANAHVLDIGQMCRTDAGMVWLHRVYVPPEVRHGSTADTRADTYSLGRILHFALVGSEPDEKDERMPRLDTIVKDNPNALARIVRKCTTLDPNERYFNATELLDDFDRMKRHVPVGLPHPEIDGKEESSMVDDAKMRSRPPPAKSRPPRSNMAIELTTSSDEYRYWSVGMAVGLGFLGILMFAIPLIATHLVGAESITLDVVFWASALPLGFATPGFTSSRTLTRLLVSVALAAILVFAAPLDAVRGSRTAGLKSENLAEVVAAIKELKEAGETDFRSMKLDGADLSGMDLSNITLDGSSLKNANLSNAKFRKTSMDNVDFSGADISSADLGDIPGAWVKGLESAKCNPSTTMPFGYVCKEDKPLPKAAAGK